MPNEEALDKAKTRREKGEVVGASGFAGLRVGFMRFLGDLAGPR
ncbi:MAG: hypothetical protein V9H26_10975 [Verrucomicrobiota bacterium]